MTNPELAPDMPEEKRITADEISEIIQDNWNDWCADTGCFPCDFTIEPRKHLSFRAGSWAEQVSRSIIFRLKKKGILYAPPLPEFVTQGHADLAPQAGSVDVEGLKREVCAMIGEHHTQATHEAVREAIEIISKRNLLAAAPVGGDARPAIPGLQEAIELLEEEVYDEIGQLIHDNPNLNRKHAQALYIVLQAARQSGVPDKYIVKTDEDGALEFLPLVPDGYVIVPREPEIEQVMAGEQYVEQYEDIPTVQGIYRAMISAARDGRD